MHDPKDRKDEDAAGEVAAAVDAAAPLRAPRRRGAGVVPGYRTRRNWPLIVGALLVFISFFVVTVLVSRVIFTESPGVSPLLGQPLPQGEGAADPGPESGGPPIHGDDGPEFEESETEGSEVEGSEGDALGVDAEVMADPDQALLAVVIDDWGYPWEAADDFLAFPGPLTVAVIPHLSHTREHAVRAHDAGHQVILHLPMEPLESHWDLGPRAVTSVLADDEITDVVVAALNDVPFASGMNNHMGSKATADARIMARVLQVSRAHGLFFLDSRTTAQSVVPRVAREEDVSYLVNDRFIDPDPEWTRVRDRIVAGAATAKRRGYAIVIGHVRAETLLGLEAALPLIDAEGVRLATLWEVLERAQADEVPETATAP